MVLGILALFNLNLEHFLERAYPIEHHRVTFSLALSLFLSFTLNLVLDIQVVILQLLQV